MLSPGRRLDWMLIAFAIVFQGALELVPELLSFPEGDT
jgi:hypothetical protein